MYSLVPAGIPDTSSTVVDMPRIALSLQGLQIAVSFSNHYRS